MSYKDMFHKLVYVNKDDPDFVEGVSPSISAGQLNAMQDGIVGALTGADVLTAGVEQNAADIATLNTHTTNIVCEIVNTSITIPTSAWVENSTAQRIETVYSNDMIRADTDVELVLCDAQKGRFAISALDPVDGSITLFTAEAFPDEPLIFQLKISEVRSLGES